MAIFGRKCRHSAPIDNYPSVCCRCLAFFRGHGRQPWFDSRRNRGASHIWHVFHEFFFVSCCCCVRSCDLNKPSSQRERERPCFAYVFPFCLLLAFTYFGVCETPHTLSAICSLRSLKQKATRTLIVLFWTGQQPPGRPTVNCHRFTRDKSRRNFHPPSALVVVAEVTAGVRCLTGRHLFQSLIS